MKKTLVHHAVMSFPPFEHNLFSHSLFQLLISAFLPNKKKLILFSPEIIGKMPEKVNKPTSIIFLLQRCSNLAPVCWKRELYVDYIYRHFIDYMTNNVHILTTLPAVN